MLSGDVSFQREKATSRGLPTENSLTNQNCRWHNWWSASSHDLRRLTAITLGGLCLQWGEVVGIYVCLFSLNHSSTSPTAKRARLQPIFTYDGSNGAASIGTVPFGVTATKSSFKGQFIPNTPNNRPEIGKPTKTFPANVTFDICWKEAQPRISRIIQ